MLPHDLSGSGPPLLLLHGFASTRLFYAPLVPRLARHHTVLVPDLPGHGEAPALPDDVAPTPSAFVDAIVADLDERGWERPHIVGHSFGGLLALELGRRGRATTVTALGPSGPASERERRQAYRILNGQRRLGLVLGPLVPLLAKSRVVRVLTMSPSATRPWRMDPTWAATTAREFVATRRFRETLEAIDVDAMLPGLATISVPTLLAYGARDHIVPAVAAERYRDALPAHVRYATLPGVGHAFTTDDPDATLATIRAGIRGSG